MSLDAWIPFFVALVPLAIVGINLRAAAKLAKKAADAAVEAAKSTSLKLDAVSGQLDGRLTHLLEVIEKRVDAAYQDGFAKGQHQKVESAIVKEQAVLTQIVAAGQDVIVEKVTKVEEHLTEQDAVASRKKE